jgi:3-hydroxyisobutyryl-CoA hydrolase
VSQKGIVDYFVKERRGKQGVKEVVQEIVKRKTKKVDGQLVWVSDSGAKL